MKPCTCKGGPRAVVGQTGDHGNCGKCGGAWTLYEVITKYGLPILEDMLKNGIEPRVNDHTTTNGFTCDRCGLSLREIVAGPKQPCQPKPVGFMTSDVAPKFLNQTAEVLNRIGALDEHMTDQLLKESRKYGGVLGGALDADKVYAEWARRCDEYVHHLERLPETEQRRRTLRVEDVARFFIAYWDRWPLGGSLAALSRSDLSNASCTRARNFCEVHADTFGFFLAHLAFQLSDDDRRALFTGLRDDGWKKRNRGRL